MRKQQKESLPINDLMPLFGHQKTYPSDRSDECKDHDFVIWVLANLAGASIKALSKFTGQSEDTRLDVLYRQAKQRLFDHFSVYEKPDNSFAMIDDEEMEKFLDAIFMKGLLNMPRKKMKTLPAYEDVLSNLGLDEEVSDDLGLEDEEPETETEPETEPAVKETTAKPRTRKRRGPGRPKGRIQEDKEVYWDKAITVGEKQPINPTQKEVQAAVKYLSRRKYAPTAQTLTDYLVDKKGWGYQEARQVVRRYLRRHLYLTYA